MDIKEYISSGVIEAYVLGLATEQELGLLECVRKNHPEVELAIREAQESLEKVATIQAVAPEDHLKESIWNKISALDIEIDQESSAGISHTNTKEERTEPDAFIVTGRLSRPGRWAAAAAVLLALSVGTNIYLYRQGIEAQDDLAIVKIEQENVQSKLNATIAKWQIINSPTVKSIALNGTSAHSDLSARVFWDTKKESVYLLADQLPVAPEGMQYQLWAIVDGKPLDVGLVPLSGTDEMHSMLSVKDAQAFAITLEKAGGSPVPTLSELRVIGNI